MVRICIVSQDIVIIKGEKLGTFDFVVEMLVLVWDTPGLMLILTEFEGL